MKREYVGTFILSIPNSFPLFKIPCTLNFHPKVKLISENIEHYSIARKSD